MKLPNKLGNAHIEQSLSNGKIDLFFDKSV